MAQPLIEEKIESLRRCVRRPERKRGSTPGVRVESKRPEQLDLLQKDWDLQDILALNLTRAVQLCVDLAMPLIAESDQPTPDTMAESFVRLKGAGRARSTPRDGCTL